MSEIVILKAEPREDSGKGASRSLRRQGRIPAIIYGANKDEVKISTELKEIYKQFLRGNFSSKLVDLEIGKEKIRTIPCAVQLHPVTDVPMHADFLRVTDSTKVHVFVKVKFLNHEASPGLDRGGVLSIVRRQIELVCRADSIPSELEIDLSGLDIGESVHSHSVKYPEGTHPLITDRDFTIATIVGRTAEEEEEAPAAEGEAAEGEAAAEGAATGAAEEKAE